MWWWLWVVWIFLLIWLVLMPFGWGYRRWGRPAYRYRRPSRGDIHPHQSVYDSGWGWWSVVIWLILIALITWLIIALST